MLTSVSEFHHESVASALREKMKVQVAFTVFPMRLEDNGRAYAIIELEDPQPIPHYGALMPEPLVSLKVTVFLSYTRVTPSGGPNYDGNFPRVFETRKVDLLGERLTSNWGYFVAPKGDSDVRKSYRITHSSGNPLTQAVANAYSVIAEANSILLDVTTERFNAITRYESEYAKALAS
jgi:hypothetical protein